jgi:hypothetical protein
LDRCGGVREDTRAAIRGEPLEIDGDIDFAVAKHFADLAICHRADVNELVECPGPERKSAEWVD